MRDRISQLNSLKKQVLQLPEPEDVAKQHSLRLIDYIRDQIKLAGTMITFKDYMSMALTAPALGYYVSGNQKFGVTGDFITAPEISPLFSKCIANQCAEILAALHSNTVILEFGAGSGVMAANILEHLATLDALPAQYLIMEISPDLRKRQRDSLQALVPEQLSRVTWLDELPTKPVCGVLLANEVLDALPVHRFFKSGDNLGELYVGWHDDSFQWIEGGFSSQRLKDKFYTLKDQLPDGYVSEINLAAEAWVASMANIIDAGSMVLIDYGFTADEYYHPQRSSGTLMCHYRHRNHEDPFVYPGLQDITAHVDFSSIARIAVQSGFQVNGFATQAMFLLANGLDQLLQGVDTESMGYLKLAQQVKTLTMPGEMGELFKVLMLSKNINKSMRGFNLQNLAYKL